MDDILPPGFRGIQREGLVAGLRDLIGGAYHCALPPLLKDGNPVVPQATVTTLDANVDLLTLKLASAVLLAYIAPPPPFASPRRPDSALENTEHSENTDIEITIVRFAPVEMRGLFRVIDNPVLKLEIWCE